MTRAVRSSPVASGRNGFTTRVRRPRWTTGTCCRSGEASVLHDTKAPTPGLPDHRAPPTLTAPRGADEPRRTRPASHGRGGGGGFLRDDANRSLANPGSLALVNLQVLVKRAKRLVSLNSEQGFLRESALFGGSTILEQGSRLLTGLVAAATLGPVVWGTWYLLNLVLRYGALFHLGAINGMNREVPAARGRGDEEAADQLRKSAMGFTLLSYALVALLLTLAYGFLEGVVPVRELALTLALLGVQQMYGFAGMSFKATARFGLVSRLQVASAIVYPVLVIPGAWLGGLPGFILGQVAAYAVLVLVARKLDNATFATGLHWRTIRGLIRVGFPIMMVGVVHALLTTVDRWIIAARIGSEALGHYSLAIMAVGAVQLIPQVFAQQVYPRMAFGWSARSDPAELGRLARQQAGLALVAVAGIVAVIAALAPMAIRAMLPAYEPGIGALLVSLTAPLVSVVGQGYGNVLNVIDRQGVYLGLIIGAIAVNALVGLVAVGPLGIVGVAIGTVSGMAFLSVGLFATGSLALKRLRPTGSG